MPTLDEMLRDEFSSNYENLVGSLVVSTEVKPYTRRSLNEIEMAVLHHAAAPRKTTWQAVAQYHVSSNGWPGIAYHIGVRDYGGVCKVSLLNQPETRSYHAHAYGNDHGLAVCVAGNFETDVPTPAEINALGRIVSVLRQWATWLDQMPVVGHGDVPGNVTDCPERGLKALLPALNKEDGMIRDETLRKAIWDAAKSGQTVAVNDESAIIRFMAEQGYHPIGNERDVLLNGEWQGVSQLGYQDGGSPAGVAFFSTNKVTGEWEVSVVEEQ